MDWTESLSNSFRKSWTVKHFLWYLATALLYSALYSSNAAYNKIAKNKKKDNVRISFCLKYIWTNIKTTEHSNYLTKEI